MYNNLCSDNLSRFLLPRLMCLLLVVPAGCSRRDADKGTIPAMSDHEQVAELLASLRSMPDWTGLPYGADAPEARDDIKRRADAIASYETPVIRHTMKLFREEEWKKGAQQGFAADGKLLIVNRYLFALPATIRRDSPHFRFFGGGWICLPISGNPNEPVGSDEMDMRWPWSVDKEGVWQLTGSFGAFSGPSYQPLEAFDYYDEHFGRRATGIEGK